MSVICSSRNALVIDHEEWLLRNYGETLSSKVKDSERYFNHYHQLFDLKTPFLMDGQAEKVAKEMECAMGSMEPPKKKKRIVKDALIAQNSELYEEISYIMEALATLRNMAEFKKFFCYIPNSEDFRRNNLPIRDTRKRFMEASNVQLPVPYKGSTSHSHLILTIDDTRYLLPPKVEYICDDVRNILSHTLGNKYDLIVMDPPWWNKYIRRRRDASGSNDGYEMMSVEDILQIPLKELLDEEGFLVIWCTNNNTQMKALKEGLHNWDVELISTWFWLKLTRGGELVTPMCRQTHGKLPYERILIARKLGSKNCIENIRDGRVVCSVPSGLHSHKPPLSEIFKEYKLPHARCMEIFARYVIPGWTSYGLEVLKLQNSFLFDT